MQIHQILVGASYGDAITNEAYRLRSLLQRVVPSEIFAAHIDPRLKDVHPLKDYSMSNSSEDLLIAYLSIGEERVFRFLSSRTEGIVLRYHSMTPPEEVEPYDLNFARLLALGREQVTELAKRASLGLAGSHFSEKELIEMGFRSTATCPLLVSVDNLLAQEPSPPPNASIDGPIVLCVGRVVPNKALEEVLIAFHVLQTYHLPTASLVFVGGRQFPVYDSMLGALRSDLGLRGVNFAGRVTARELAGLYRSADALICLSRHEGFCAPLIEAMAFGVPVVAVDSTAVAETIGGAGCVLDERSPTLIAEALAAVIGEAGLRRQLIHLGYERVRELNPATVGASMLSQLTAAIR